MAPKRVLDEARAEEPQSKKSKNCSKENTKIVTNLQNSNIYALVEEIKEYKSLHEAAKNGLLDIVKHLLLQGVNVNQKNEDGQSPLHLSSENGHVDNSLFHLLYYFFYFSEIINIILAISAK